MRLIVFIIAFMVSYLSFSQVDYPFISIDENGKTTVVLTIDQARIIDNKLEILNLLVESKEFEKDISELSLKVVNEKDEVIAKQGLKISKLYKLLDNNDDEIINLKEQINLYQLNNSILINRVENKDKEIDIHLDRIETLEKKTFWGSILSGTIIVTLLSFLVIN